jgi:hypothetical protein
MINTGVKLLSENNNKTIKGENYTLNNKPIKTLILYLSPSVLNSKGINLCSHSSVGCRSACLFGSGFGGMYDRVRLGRVNKTEWYLSDRLSFMKKLINEIELAIIKYSNDWTLCIRLNGTTDIRYEKILINGKNIFEYFPNIQFYDYTKNNLRFEFNLPLNYHLTFNI